LGRRQLGGGKNFYQASEKEESDGKKKNHSPETSETPEQRRKGEEKNKKMDLTTTSRKGGRKEVNFTSRENGENLRFGRRRRMKKKKRIPEKKNNALTGKLEEEKASILHISNIWGKGKSGTFFHSGKEIGRKVRMVKKERGKVKQQHVFF